MCAQTDTPAYTHMQTHALTQTYTSQRNLSIKCNFTKYPSGCCNWNQNVLSFFLVFLFSFFPFSSSLSPFLHPPLFCLPPEQTDRCLARTMVISYKLTHTHVCAHTHTHTRTYTHTVNVHAVSGGTGCFIEGVRMCVCVCVCVRVGVCVSVK